jgi:hypothetical protein
MVRYTSPWHAFDSSKLKMLDCSALEGGTEAKMIEVLDMQSSFLCWQTLTAKFDSLYCSD